jgi:hypothetical protein
MRRENAIWLGWMVHHGDGRNWGVLQGWVGDGGSVRETSRLGDVRPRPSSEEVALKDTGRGLPRLLVLVPMSGNAAMWARSLSGDPLRGAECGDGSSSIKSNPRYCAVNY